MWHVAAVWHASSVSHAANIGSQQKNGISWKKLLFAMLDIKMQLRNICVIIPDDITSNVITSNCMFRPVESYIPEHREKCHSRWLSRQRSSWSLSGNGSCQAGSVRTPLQWHEHQRVTSVNYDAALLQWLLLVNILYKVPWATHLSAGCWFLLTKRRKCGSSALPGSAGQLGSAGRVRVRNTQLFVTGLIMNENWSWNTWMAPCWLAAVQL